MAKKLSEAQLASGISNAITAVIDTCGGEVDEAISNGLRAEYQLGSAILSESEKIHLVEGEKLTGDAKDKEVKQAIGKSRNAIVDGLIESNRFDFGRTKFLDAVRVASKFGETQFENLATEFNRTAIVELASIADDKQAEAMDAVRAATKKAEEKNLKSPNVREIIKSFRPASTKAKSVSFPLKVAESLASDFNVDFFAQLKSEKQLTKKVACESLLSLFEQLAHLGIDVEKASERARAATTTAKAVVDSEKKPSIDNIKTPEGEDFSYGSEAYEKRRAELVDELGETTI